MAAYTATPGPNGPRSSNLRRSLDDSATNRPFLVPMARSTRSDMGSTSGDGGQEHDQVPRREHGVEAAAVAHVLAVDEHADVPPHGAGLVAQPAVQRGMAPLELVQHAAHAVRRDLQL